MQCSPSSLDTYIPGVPRTSQCLPSSVSYCVHEQTGNKYSSELEGQLQRFMQMGSTGRPVRASRGPRRGGHFSWTCSHHGNKKSSRRDTEEAAAYVHGGRRHPRGPWGQQVQPICDGWFISQTGRGCTWKGRPAWAPRWWHREDPEPTSSGTHRVRSC